MRRSTDHILCTHGGNLPLPQSLEKLIPEARNNADAIAGKLRG
jgi:5-methyltetrahydropteroyltriglutamate--homocysteine methyltransferase